MPLHLGIALVEFATTSIGFVQLAVRLMLLQVAFECVQAAAMLTCAVCIGEGLVSQLVELSLRTLLLDLSLLYWSISNHLG